MSDAAESLDLRLPIGALFTVIGVIVGGFGAATLGDTERYARSTGININLIWGIVMLVFGVLMLLGARRGRRGGTLREAAHSREGRATERLEKEEGLER